MNRVLIELCKLHPFEGHPYKVQDDEEMDALTESGRAYGIMSPLIVRPMEQKRGEYEVVSGHRRMHAAAILGMEKIPAIIREMSDDEAIVKCKTAN